MGIFRQIFGSRKKSVRDTETASSSSESLRDYPDLITGLGITSVDAENNLLGRHPDIEDISARMFLPKVNSHGLKVISKYKYISFDEAGLHVYNPYYEKEDVLDLLSVIVCLGSEVLHDIVSLLGLNLLDIRNHVEVESRSGVETMDYVKSLVRSMCIIDGEDLTELINFSALSGVWYYEFGGHPDYKDKIASLTRKLLADVSFTRWFPGTEVFLSPYGIAMFFERGDEPCVPEVSYELDED